MTTQPASRSSQNLQRLREFECRKLSKALPESTNRARGRESFLGRNLPIYSWGMDLQFGTMTVFAIRVQEASCPNTTS